MEYIGTYNDLDDSSSERENHSAFQENVATIFPYWTYVIELEDEYYFVFFSSSSEEMQILMECELLYDFPKLHKPVSIVERHSLANGINAASDINHCVKVYMIRYGIDFVRGGSYCEPILSEEQKTALDVELKWMSSFSLGIEIQTDEMRRQIMNHYLCEIQSEEDIETKRETLCKTEVKYNRSKNAFLYIFHMYNSVDSSVESKASSVEANTFASLPNPAILDEIDWLQDHAMNCSFQFSDIDDTYFQDMPLHTQRYNKLIPILKKIRKIYYAIFKKVKDLTIDEIYLHFPEYVFDHFFIHLYSDHRRTFDISVWVTICDIFREMTTAVLEKLKKVYQELETYTESFEKWTQEKRYALHYLQNELRK
jgi:hypothetical protein